MSNEVLQLIGSLFAVAVTFLGNWLINRAKLKELKMAQDELKSQIKIKEEAAEIERQKGSADLVGTYLNITNESGKMISTRDVKITELQAAMEILNKKVDTLMADRRRLEYENARKDDQIHSLQNRVKFLEDAMRKAGVPIPENGDTQDAKTEESD